MILTIVGSLFTLLAVALPEILKWMERNNKVDPASLVPLDELPTTTKVP